MKLVKKTESKESIPRGPIQVWGKKVDWEKRVKAVCKPCWELKYCPYGPLIEDMPIQEKNDDKSCRIFGHDCPVFYVAEPFTETKDLRNISRSIPRNVQFRVLKRDNQICRECGNSVREEEIEFDHIIPWSKGGCSDEHNVKLLCKKCNRVKGDRFEEKYLIGSLADHLREPVPFSFIKMIFQITEIVWESFDWTSKEISREEIKKFFGRKKEIDEDALTAGMFKDIRQFFLGEKPSELSSEEFEALRYRWGFIDKQFHSILQTAEKLSISAEKLYLNDLHFISRLGFYIRIKDSDKEKWLKH